MCSIAAIGINIVMSEAIVQSLCGVTLVGGGELTPVFVTYSLTIAPCLVAADGAADALQALGLMPDAVIGDLDSISPAVRAALPPDRLHLVAEQETTDFDKCLRHIRAPFILAVGFTGARIDHALACFNALTRHPDRRCLILGPVDLCFLAPLSLELALPVGTRLSLFPLGPVQGRSQGLRWPINGLKFAPDGVIGTSNETDAAAVSLAFSAQRMLVILPTPCLGAALAALGAEPRPGEPPRTRP